MLEQALSSLPGTDQNVVAVLSGGLDSSIMTMMLVRKYGADRVKAVSFDYGQKQKLELQKAIALCSSLQIEHSVLDLRILGEIAKPMSANISGTNIAMPTIQDVLGDPSPSTYIPNRNMIMYSIAAAKAEVMKARYIFCGLQVHDSYSYYDTTQAWVDGMNSVLAQNRKNPICITAPFSHLSKYEEILLCRELGQLHLLSSTLTCYNPSDQGESCGKCPSCSERIMNFAKAGLKDPIPYEIDIPWDKIIRS
mgnify:CR=1 FL=1